MKINKIIIIILMLLLFIPVASHAVVYFPASLTGGTSGSLDSIDGAKLFNNTKAIIIFGPGHATYPNKFLFYSIDADSAAAESSPDVISPDLNAGDKRWILKILGNADDLSIGDLSDVSGPGTDAQMLVNVSGILTPRSISGDVTIDNTGAVTISALAVDTAELAADAVTDAKVEDDITINNTSSLSTTGLITGEAIQFDLAPSQSPAEGLMYWNATDGTLNLGMPGGNVNLQIGQEMLVAVRNASGSDLENGEIIYISGSIANRPLIELADADTELASSKTFAMLTEDIDNNSNGYVNTSGIVRGEAAQPIDTSSYAEGTALWLSQTAGEFTDTKPTSPAHAVFIGYVTKQHASEGEILIRITNGFEVFELHDVADGLETPTNNAFLKYNTGTSLWEEIVDIPLGTYTSGNYAAGDAEAGAATSVAADVIGTTHMADEDHGDVNWTSGAATVQGVDTDSVALTTDTTGNYAAGDAEAGNATGVANDVIGTAHMADEDHGDVNWTSGVATVQGVDADSVALTTDTTGNYAAGDAEAGNATGVACAGSCISDGEVDANLTISGGTVDNSIIGGSVKAAGSFNALDATSVDTPTITSPDDLTITPAGGDTTISGNIKATDGNIVLNSLNAPVLSFGSLDAGTDLDANTAYVYWVIAIGEKGTYSNFSNPIACFTDGAANQTCTLNWTAVDGAIGYQLFYQKEALTAGVQDDAVYDAEVTSADNSAAVDSLRTDTTCGIKISEDFSCRTGYDMVLVNPTVADQITSGNPPICRVWKTSDTANSATCRLGLDNDGAMGWDTGTPDTYMMFDPKGAKPLMSGELWFQHHATHAGNAKFYTADTSGTAVNSGLYGVALGATLTENSVDYIITTIGDDHETNEVLTVTPTSGAFVTGDRGRIIYKALTFSHIGDETTITTPDQDFLPSSGTALKTAGSLHIGKPCLEIGDIILADNNYGSSCDKNSGARLIVRGGSSDANGVLVWFGYGDSSGFPDLSGVAHRTAHYVTSSDTGFLSTTGSLHPLIVIGRRSVGIDYGSDSNNSMRAEWWQEKVESSAGATPPSPGRFEFKTGTNSDTSSFTQPIAAGVTSRIINGNVNVVITDAYAFDAVAVLNSGTMTGYAAYHVQDNVGGVNPHAMLIDDGTEPIAFDGITGTKLATDGVGILGIDDDHIVTEGYAAIGYDGGIGASDNPTTLTIGSADTMVILNAANTDVDLSCGEVSGVTCDDITDFDLTINDVNAAGPYLIMWDMSFNGTATNEYHCAPYHNNSRLVNATGMRKFGAAGDVGSFGGNDIITLANGDIINMKCENTTAGNDLIIDHMNISIAKIGQ